MTKRPMVLFLCVHNAGRSQMAAAWLDHLAGGRVDTVSAGSEPADQVNPLAVQAMAEVGIELAGTAPRRWTDAMIDSADVVITMGCGDSCPVVPGKRYEDWDVADPHGADIGQVRMVRDEIEKRVRNLISQLGAHPVPS
ncbi:MAG: arsenate reductase ArsC [Acidimicrobiia bacterium]